MFKFIKTAKEAIIGKAKDLNDPRLFHKISLIAFFAWVGLGADGLSSSCYGPEESFLALQGHACLGIFVAAITTITIFVLASSYSQIVELFPTGGGGYLVASKLLSPTIGMISGCALIIDYVLTIAISIASGSDAIFSLLPYSWQPFKLWAAMAVIIVLIVLNLRGVKESVVPLVPIFLFFVVTHVFIIIYGLMTHLSDVNALRGTIAGDIRTTYYGLGAWGILFLIMRAYSMGAGTYTGIEAVSNGLPILRQPQVETAKKTMRYMAFSLAFMVIGLMLGYLLYKVSPENGKTLNAVLVGRVTESWPKAIAPYFIMAVLFSEAILLFVAAQTGFLDGPRVIANMAIDRWFPFQFALLSERFVIKNGILLMGGAALVILIVGKASVKFLVILYSINVFITFLLSQLGMVRYWWRRRLLKDPWRRKMLINGTGLVLTAFILLSVTAIKFFQGGWLTLAITGTLILVAVLLKRYYYKTRALLARLDKLVYEAANTASPFPSGKPGVPEFDPDAKTAVILVNGFNGMGLHTLLNSVKLFGGQLKNFVFMQAGIIDTENFKGKEEIDKLKAHVDGQLAKYVDYMHRQGFYARSFSTFGTDIAQDINLLAHKIFEEYPNSIFFGGQIVFAEETFLSRLLYNHTTFAVQRRLHQDAIPFLIIPIRVS